MRGTQRKSTLDQAIVQASLECLEDFGASGTNIAAYNPLPSEPGPADFAARLAPAARAVFLPISLADGVLAWAQAGQDDALGSLGIAEPRGARFTSAVLRSCGMLVVPALAVDRQGMRLGKGAGYYDRALAGLDVPVAAVVFDWEVVEAVPHDAHDQAVDAVITPEGFFRV
ncbi:5-formyltetrahydrofolate cyclo-ligase family protein [Corynebacterium fournieri]|nr:5-formyltetrahydrofolate cyclo-ligase family protein [Corynebacterium fournieri]